MAQIKVSNLTFAYEGSYDNVFENVSFVIDTDWRLGFTGRSFDYFPFDAGDKSRNAIDIVEEVCPDYEYWKISRELSLLDLDDSVLFRPFELLSGGEQTKVIKSTYLIHQ